MRSLLLSSLVVCIAGAAMAPCAHAAATQAPPLQAALESCNASALPIERLASFVASMPALARAERMRIRFDLERRRPAERRWRRIQAPGFGTWERSAANVAGFVFHKRINGLWVPASYRARVRFRWVAADGTIVRRAQARTQACVQPDLRPNLVPGALTAILDAQPGLAIYTLIVRNSGHAAASAFGVQVGSGGAEVAALGPGAQRAVVVVSLACRPGETIIARVDADRRVEESVERGNVSRRRCPLPLG
jgi:hypothetical protein